MRSEITLPVAEALRTLPTGAAQRSTLQLAMYLLLLFRVVLFGFALSCVRFALLRFHVHCLNNIVRNWTLASFQLSTNCPQAQARAERTRISVLHPQPLRSHAQTAWTR